MPLRARQQTNDHQKECLSRVHSIETEFRLLAQMLGYIHDDIKRLQSSVDSNDARIKTLEMKPGEKWESTMQKIIQLLVAGVVGGITVRLFGS